MKVLLIIITSILIIVSECCDAKTDSELEITADKVEFHRKKNIIIFTGNVKSIHENNILTADRITKDEKKQILTAEGNIKLNYNVSAGEKTELGANFAKYSVSDKKTHLWGNSYLVYKSTKFPEVRIHADKILLEENEQCVYFDSNVVILSYGPTGQKESCAKSEHAKYDYTTRQISLYSDNNENISHRPSVEYVNDYKIRFDANKILILSNERKFIFVKQVAGKIEPVDKHK